MAQKNNSEKINVHAKHRERLRNKLLNFGADSLEDHELLELLLFSAIPRKNTNETAHLLLKKFGSFSGVLEAGYNNLKTVKGIGTQSAAAIILANEINRRYHVDKACDKNKILTEESLTEYIVPLFHGYTDEKLIVVLMDAELRVKDFKKISDGAKGRLSIDLRAITKAALGADASNVIVAHNHPNGVELPSKADLDVTIAIQKALDLIDVRLVDHLIVANNNTYSIFKHLQRLGYKE